MASILLIAMTLVGAVLAMYGGYVYQKNQRKEAISGSSFGKAKMVGATYLMSFGGILVLAGVFFLLELHGT